MIIIIEEIRELIQGKDLEEPILKVQTLNFIL
jgi:nitrogen fixation protein